MHAVSPTLQDPTYSPRAHSSLFERFWLRYLNDPRDLPFIRLSLTMLLTTVPFAVYLYWPGNFRWWLGGIYFLFNTVVFMGPYILMLHNTSHRPLFKRRYVWLNRFIPWILGPFYGETPETYFAHHIGMHHPENNLARDLSSTMAYRRDSFRGFLHYFLRFMFLGLYDLGIYFRSKNRMHQYRRMLLGEFSFYALVVLLMFVHGQATLVVFVIPLVFTRFMMMAGNWAQHAFIDPITPGNCYRNSITCINTPYNRRCFNDGYHIGHHLYPSMHWTEMPREFERNVARYAQERAIVFRKVDFFLIWLMLMLKRYDWLAHYYVDLQPDRGRSREDIIALLRRRTRRIYF